MTLRVKDIPTSYDEAENLLTKDGTRKISKNGWLIMSPQEIMPRCILLKLYQTVIVTYFPDGSMKLNHGNHITRTTAHWLSLACGNKGIIERSVSNHAMYFYDATGINTFGQEIPCVIE